MSVLLTNAGMDYSVVCEVSKRMLGTQLYEIKLKFRDIIKSERSLSLVENFEDLVKLLIKRDYVDPSNRRWGSVERICRDALHMPRVVPHLSTQSRGNSQITQLHPRVLDHVSQAIGGYSWRPLARGLDVKEYEISRIEANLGDDPYACTWEVLQLYPKNMADPSWNNVHKKLEKALRCIRRPELAEHVRTILDSEANN